MNPVNDEINPYLEQEVLSASPIRLRWMLIQRAEELCGEVRRLWGLGKQEQAKGWLLRIREILGELLDGVQDQHNPVSQPVSDFYVFLLQLLSEAENHLDSDKMDTLGELLHIENETWQMVVQQQPATNIAEESVSGHNSALFPNIDHQWDSALSPGELNLEL